jgi:hypothetical protein
MSSSAASTSLSAETGAKSSRASPRPTPRAEGSPRPAESKIESGRKDTGRDAKGEISARDTARSESAASATARSEPMETFRTEMSTARVHTALAALAAEKQALIAKLANIDSALETDKKKKSVRLTKK